MKTLWTATLAAAAILFLIPQTGSACEAHAGGDAPTVAQVSTGDDESAVAITAEGTQFDPAITSEQVPPGAWMCDMGTVHYARLEQGDGNCPVCGMHLTERGIDHDAHGGH